MESVLRLCHLANRKVYKTTNFKEMESLFDITQKLILEHSEEILKETKSKVRVYSDSVLCLGKINESKDAIVRWEGQVEEFKMSPSYKDLLGIDGEAIEFECNISRGFSSLQVLQEIQNDLRKRNIEPKKFTDWIICMSMSNDIDWTIKGNG